VSWDTEVKEERCFCGAGTLVLTVRSDDWGRDAASAETRCTRCSQEYEFKVSTKPDGDTTWGWVKRLTPAELAKRARRDEERLEREATTLSKLREEFGPALVDFVSPYTSRKALWEFLSKSRLTTSVIWSFAAFNRLVVERGRSAAIIELISPQTETVLRALLTQSK
jgi:hypothetical protein